MPRASITARYIDCDKLREELIAALEKRLQGPVTDPCIRWIPAYLDEHLDEMTAGSYQWLQQAIERSKLDGQTYDEAVQGIDEEIANCNAPAEPSPSAEGLKVAVSTRLQGRTPSRAKPALPATRREARVSVPITPRPPCEPVPEAVFIKAVVVTMGKVESNASIEIESFQGYPPQLLVEAAISGHMLAQPQWYEPPPGIDIEPGGWDIKIPGTIGVDYRWEIDGSPVAIISTGLDFPIDQSGSWSIDESRYFYLSSWPEAGWHTLSVVLTFNWEGTILLECCGFDFLTGTYRIKHYIDPWTTQGDLTITKDFCVIDMGLIELRVVGHAGGDGSENNPYRFYSDEPVTLDLRLYNGNPIEATFRPDALKPDEVTMQPQEEIAAVAIDPPVLLGLRYEGIYEIVRHVVSYRPAPPESCPPACIIKPVAPRGIYTDTYRELADVNKIVITEKAGQFASGTGTENDPYILNSFSPEIIVFEARNENTVGSAKIICDDSVVIIAAGETHDIAKDIRFGTYTPMNVHFECTISCAENRRCFFNADAPVLRQLFIRRPMPTKDEFFYYVTGPYPARSSAVRKAYLDCSTGEWYYKDTIELYFWINDYDAWEAEFIEHNFFADTIGVTTTDHSVTNQYPRRQRIKVYGEIKSPNWEDDDYYQDNGGRNCKHFMDFYEVKGNGIIRVTCKETGQSVDYYVTADDFYNPYV